MRQQLGQVGEDSILIYIIMTEDANGKQYSDREAIQMIVNNARVPAMRMVEASVGEGLLGGNMVSMYKSGEIVADISMKIMQGADSSNIAVVDSPNVYCVDERVMEKFDLDMSLLPEGTVIVNHQPDFWERNREVLIPGSILVGAMLVIMHGSCLTTSDAGGCWKNWNRRGGLWNPLLCTISLRGCRTGASS